MPKIKNIPQFIYSKGLNHRRDFSQRNAELWGEEACTLPKFLKNPMKSRKKQKVSWGEGTPGATVNADSIFCSKYKAKRPTSISNICYILDKAPTY